MKIIEVKNLHKDYIGYNALKNLNFSIAPGEKVVILGPSGSGKSTLLRTLCYLDQDFSGDIFIEGTSIREITDIYTKVGIVFQGFNLFPHFNVLHNITLSLRKVLKIEEEEAQKRALGFLTKVGLAGKKFSLPRQLSMGESQRVAIARTMVMRPQILLLDEPTSSLDPETTENVLKLMASSLLNDTTVICVSHEIEFARRFATKVLFMDLGQIIEFTDARDFFIRPLTQRAMHFLQKN